MAMHPKAWMTSYLLDLWLSYFVKCVQSQGGKTSQEKRNLLILDGHKSHFTVIVVRQTRSLGLDLVALPSHALSVLQPLDIACLKFFKSAFRHCRNIWSLVNKGCATRKGELAHWVSISLKITLTLANILADFRSSGIWPLDDTKNG